jgi:hypothetical protein
MPRLSLTKRLRTAALGACVALLLAAAPAQAETITVDSDQDDGLNGNCDLRSAVTAANTNLNDPGRDACPVGDPAPEVDRIEFDIGGGGQQSIVLSLGSLSQLIDPVAVDGTTQGGFAGTPLIEVTSAGSVFDLADGSDGSTIKGLVINDGFNGIVINAGSDGNTIAGNYVGLDDDGSTEAGNSSTGILIHSQNNVIGGLTAADRNVISGNDANGISVLTNTSPGANQILGNFIGTDALGTSAVGNDDDGVLIDGSTQNEIGGSAAGARNVISGNGRFGIFIGGSEESDMNEVKGNYIGVGADGTTSLGNASEGITIDNGDATEVGAPGAGNVIGNNRAGVRISSTNAPAVIAEDTLVQGNGIGVDAAGGPAPNTAEGVLIRFGSQDNMVGGFAAGEGNVIANNTVDGVSIVDGGSGETDGNAVLGNSIHSNGEFGGIGIDLGPTNGVTENDVGDIDTGANDEQNFPVIAGAQTNSVDTTVQGTLSSLANRTYRVELFSNTDCDGSGNGEGQTFLGAQNVITDGAGEAQIAATVSPSAAGQELTATATDVEPGEKMNTSEFSDCVEIASKPDPPPPPPPPAPSPIAPLAPAPSNAFELGKLKRNKKKGIAFLFVNVPGPGEVGLAGKGVQGIGGAGIAHKSLAVSGGQARLRIAPAKGKKGTKVRKKLRAKGKAGLKVQITYIPTGGVANTQPRKVKLVRK